MEKYNEILKLKQLLESDNIPFKFTNLYDGYHIIYPDVPGCSVVCSVIEHEFSYGHTHDLLEIAGLLLEFETQKDDVVGYLSAEDVHYLIKKDWLELSKFIKEGELS